MSNVANETQNVKTRKTVDNISYVVICFFTFLPMRLGYEDIITYICVYIWEIIH